MSGSKLSLAFCLTLISLLFQIESNLEPKDSVSCSSSCGNNEVTVRYPFRFRFIAKKCGMKGYELDCENDRPVLYLGTGRYYVLAINYDKYTIRVVDEGIRMGDNSSLPRHFLTTTILFEKSISYDLHWPKLSNVLIANIKCERQVVLDQELKDVGLAIVRTVTTSTQSTDLVTPSNYATYILFGTYSLHRSYIKIPEGCGMETMHLTFGSSMKWFRSKSASTNDSSTLFSSFHNELASGFELGWIPGYYDLHFEAIANLLEKILGVILVTKLFCGLLLLYIYLIYIYMRRHLSTFDSVENFLRNNINNLTPIGYSYREVRTMAKGFKDKLGEGGYGCVYKGKLRSGHTVAIKMLGKSKADGQEFMNEIATIGRIHHVNVVQLIGYCAQGSKRAIVLDFMPNGSLEKYIYSQEGKSSLSYKQMYDISIGIARGIEYLHRGCDMQILHFDIKPHNILLDENFTPKISDFGLAKLYPIQNSIVSLTAARGTMGYMAPELFYKNIGRISYKADVYSFGMLLMEMAGRRRNLNLNVETLSQIYFPSWIYDQLNEGKEMDMGETRTDEVEMVKKMVIVALWCIQLKPSDRPSMNNVVEMLEGGIELLHMPPKPFLTPRAVNLG